MNEQVKKRNKANKVVIESMVCRSLENIYRALHIPMDNWIVLDEKGNVVKVRQLKDVGGNTNVGSKIF